MSIMRRIQHCDSLYCLLGYRPLDQALDLRRLTLLHVANVIYTDVHELRHEKTCLCHMRTTKAQISLRVRAV